MGRPDARLAAPPARVRRQQQLLAEHPPCHLRPERAQPRAFQHTRSRRIRHHHLARPNRLHQSRHTQGRIRAQLQRVEPLVVHPAQQHMHPFQPVQRLEVDLLVPHRQVRPLDQRHAQVTREEDMLEIGLVARTRRQQGHARALTRRADPQQPVHQRPERRCNPLHLEFAERLGELLADDEPVFQQVAEAGRGLRTVADDAPLPVRPAGKVERHHLQPVPACGADTVHRAQVLRVGQHQRRGKVTVVQQVLLTVDVGQHRVEQPRPLFHPGLDPGPLLRRDQQRQQLQRPRTRAVATFGVDVVGRAVLAHNGAAHGPGGRRGPASRRSR